MTQETYYPSSEWLGSAKKEKKAKKRKGKKSLPDIVEEKDDKQEDIA
jgi:hypothetical protein